MNVSILILPFAYSFYTFLHLLFLLVFLSIEYINIYSTTNKFYCAIFFLHCLCVLPSLLDYKFLNYKDIA